MSEYDGMMDLSGVPQAVGIEILECPDPKCGPHIVLKDDDGKPMCQVAIPVKHLLSVIEVLRGMLYSKIVEDDGDERKTIQ
jgi:hypothetical protein